MKRTNSKDYQNAVRTYLEPLIREQMEERGGSGCPFKWLLMTAQEELPEKFEQKDTHTGLTYWLQGMGMWGLDCVNEDIVKVAEEWHECVLTEKEQEKVVENWFTHIALMIMRFAKRRLHDERR